MTPRPGGRPAKGASFLISSVCSARNVAASSFPFKMVANGSPRKRFERIVDGMIFLIHFFQDHQTCPSYRYEGWQMNSPAPKRFAAYGGGSGLASGSSCFSGTCANDVSFRVFFLPQQPFPIVPALSLLVEILTSQTPQRPRGDLCHDMEKITEK